MQKFFLLLLLLSLSACHKIKRNYTYQNIDFKDEMRNFVEQISAYAKTQQSGFIIIAQNGVELLTTTGLPASPLHLDYINALDGQAQEGLFLGYNSINSPTPTETTTYLKQFLQKAHNIKKNILVADYCFEPEAILADRDSIKNNDFIGFQAVSYALNNIPAWPIFNENNRDIEELSLASNFLYLINYENFSSKSQLIEQLTKTNYDVLIIDLFYNKDLPLSTEDIKKLKFKANGSKRLVISYLSIGEAEDYRYYWQSKWEAEPPYWLDEENPNWEGNYKVKYWESDWQKIIYGNDQSYLKRIIDAGFDGAYLDIIDAFEFFEQKTNL